jgi:hypothetical protein
MYPVFIIGEMIATPEDKRQAEDRRVRLQELARLVYRQRLTQPEEHSGICSSSMDL